jgi:hypothetical protein
VVKFVVLVHCMIRTCSCPVTVRSIHVVVLFSVLLSQIAFHTLCSVGVLLQLSVCLSVTHMSYLFLALDFSGAASFAHTHTATY